MRGGAATVYFPMWHYEFEDLVVLKNNKGTENSRVRQLDYSFQINKVLYQRLIDRKDITFFSPSDVPGLYDAFVSDTNKFEELYTKYEADKNIRKKTMPAIEAFSILMTERAETGRIYIQNIDLVNDHSPFNPELAPIEQSNLCCVTGDMMLNVIVDGEFTTAQMDHVVDMVNGGKDIQVLSFSTETSETEYKPVTNAMKTKEVFEYFEIEDEFGNVLKCTEDHLVYTENRGYVRADELEESDIVKIA